MTVKGTTTGSSVRGTKHLGKFKKDPYRSHLYGIKFLYSLDALYIICDVEKEHI